MKFYKILLIYYSKVKFNVVGRKIRDKTRNLTQNCTRNDPICHRIKAFYSVF